MIIELNGEKHRSLFTIPTIRLQCGRNKDRTIWIEIELFLFIWSVYTTINNKFNEV